MISDVNLWVIESPEAPAHFGLRYADFVEVNELMMETALDDPAVIELSRQVEALIAQREELIIAAVCRKHPEVATRIQTMKTNSTELKKKKAEQDKQTRALGREQTESKR